MRHLEPPRRNRRHVWRWVAATLFIVVAATTGWVFSRAQHAIDNSMQGGGGSAIDILMPKPLAGEETGRVNILLAGSSFDDTGHEGSTLTDSIMVASMDMTTKKITLISIPRDLWVEYQGKRMKINAVYPVGAAGSAGATGLGDSTAGLEALGSVVGKVTGLHIDQHVLVGYTALKDAVDAVGGIDIVINATDPRGIWDPNTGLRLPNGLVHLDGATALTLSRARNHPMPGQVAYGIADSDFGRARNQRLILGGLLQKVKSSPALANPAAIVAIFDSISTNVRTDLTVSQIRRILDLSTQSSGALGSLTIRGDSTKTLLDDYSSSSDGASSALVPVAGRFDYTQIQKYLQDALTDR